MTLKETFSNEEINDSMIKKHKKDVRDFKESILHNNNNSLFELKKNILISKLSEFKDKSWKEIKNSNDNKRTLAIQTALKAIDNNKYNPGKIDGWYGENTKKAVAKFQKENGLLQSKKNDGKFDGLAGKETITKILEILEGQATADVGAGNTGDVDRENMSQHETETNRWASYEDPEGLPDGYDGAFNASGNFLIATETEEVATITFSGDSHQPNPDSVVLDGDTYKITNTENKIKFEKVIETGLEATEEEIVVNIDNLNETQLLDAINSQYELNLKLDNRTIVKNADGGVTLKGEIIPSFGGGFVEIVFDKNLKNPKIIDNNNEYKIFSQERDQNPEKFFISKNALNIINKFVDYRNSNLYIGDKDLGLGKFDLSKADKITLIFENGGTNIAIDFNNDANLKYNFIKISGKQYRITIERNKINLNETTDADISDIKLHQKQIVNDIANGKGYGIGTTTERFGELKFVANENNGVADISGLQLLLEDKTDYAIDKVTNENISGQNKVKEFTVIDKLSKSVYEKYDFGTNEISDIKEDGDVVVIKVKVNNAEKTVKVDKGTLNNPRLVEGEYEFYIYPEKIKEEGPNKNKDKINLDGMSSVVNNDKFKVYKDNLIIDGDTGNPLKKGKFDVFTNPIAPAIVFGETGNEIRINFDVRNDLDTKGVFYKGIIYSVEIPTEVDNKDKILLTKKLENFQSTIEEIYNNIDLKNGNDNEKYLTIKKTTDIDDILIKYSGIENNIEVINASSNSLGNDLKNKFIRVKEAVDRLELIKDSYSKLNGTNNKIFEDNGYTVEKVDGKITKLVRNPGRIKLVKPEIRYISSYEGTISIDTNLPDVVKDLKLDQTQAAQA